MDRTFNCALVRVGIWSYTRLSGERIVDELGEAPAWRALAVRNAYLAELVTRPSRSPEQQALLARYARRLASRATPLGLFAGVCEASVIAGGRLHLADPSAWAVRLSIPHQRIAAHLNAAGAGARVAFVRNPTLIVQGLHARYFDFETGRVRRSSIDERELQLLEVASAPVSLDQLQRAVGEEVDIDRVAEALGSGWLLALPSLEAVGLRVDQQLALLENQAPPEISEQALAIGRRLAPRHALGSSEFWDTWQALHSTNICAPSRDHSPTGERHRFATIPTLFAAATTRAAPREVLDQVPRLVAALPELWRSREPSLRELVWRYLGEHHHHAPVPFARALRELQDIAPELGDGVSSFGGEEPQSPFIDMLARRASLARERDDPEVRLQWSELRGLAAEPRPNRYNPSIVEAFGRIRGTSDDPLLELYNVSSEPGRYISRFMQWDELAELTLQLQEIWASEEASAAADSAVLAEVAWWGSGHIADLAWRPNTYSYCIDVQTVKPTERRISLSDLSLRRGSSGPELWWERAERRVIPRLTTAVALRHAPPEVRLLLACSDRRRIWRLPAPELWCEGYSPRVRVDRLLLYPALHRVPAFVTRARRSKLENDPVVRDAFGRWRTSAGVPRFVRPFGPDMAIIDLDDPDALGDLRRACAITSFVAEEPLPATAPVAHQDGPAVAEVISHHRLPTSASVERSARTPPTRAPGVSAWFSPASRWLALQIYDDLDFREDFLARRIAAIVEEVAGEVELRNHHFVRIATPTPHLRVRLEVDEPERTLAIVGRVLDESVRLGELREWGLSTYQRELGRYGGGELIAVAEQLFSEDSAMCLLGLRDRNASDSATVRELWSIRTVHHFLRAFDLSIAGRAVVLEHRLRRFAGDESIDEALRSQVSRHYRAMAGTIQRVIGASDGVEASAPGPNPEFDDMLRIWSPRWTAFEARVRDLARPYVVALADDWPGLVEILDALVHMHANRWFGSRRLEFSMLSLNTRATRSIAHREAERASEGSDR